MSNGYPQRFDSNVRAILDAYTVAAGHMYPSELREALRQAGMPLDEEFDRLPEPPSAPDLSDLSEEEREAWMNSLRYQPADASYDYQEVTDEPAAD